ncbi:MAG: hypothetical protein PGN13_06195 [Patulibacter minatonensis]
MHPSPLPRVPLEVRPLDRDEALDLYLSQQLPGPFASALRASRAFRLITAATPGLAELIATGELRRLVQEEGFGHVVYDAPATGHLLAMLDAPGRFERAAAVGPIARRAHEYAEWVLSPKVTNVVAVTTGDALAISELGDLVDALESRLGPPHLVVANRLAPTAPGAAELDGLGAVDGLPGSAADAVRALAARARSERAQLGKITKRLGHPPLQCAERPEAPVSAVLDAFATLGSPA